MFFLLCSLLVVAAESPPAPSGPDAVMVTSVQTTQGETVTIKTGPREDVIVDDPSLLTTRPAGPEHLELHTKLGGTANVFVYGPQGMRTIVVRIRALPHRPRERRRTQQPARNTAGVIGDLRLSGAQSLSERGGFGNTALQASGWMTAPVAGGIVQFVGEAAGGLEIPRLLRAQLSYRRGNFTARLGDNSLSMGALGPRQGLMMRGLQAEVLTAGQSQVTAFGGSLADPYSFFELAPVQLVGFHANGRRKDRRLEWNSRTIGFHVDATVRPDGSPVQASYQFLNDTIVRYLPTWGLVEAEALAVSLGGGLRGRVVREWDKLRTEVGSEIIEGGFVNVLQPEVRLDRRQLYLRTHIDGERWQPHFAAGTGRESLDYQDRDTTTRYDYLMAGASHRTTALLTTRGAAQATWSTTEQDGRAPVDVRAIGGNLGAMLAKDGRRLLVDGGTTYTTSPLRDQLALRGRVYAETNRRLEDGHDRLALDYQLYHETLTGRASGQDFDRMSMYLSSLAERRRGSFLAMGNVGVGYSTPDAPIRTFAQARVAFDPGPRHRIEGGLSVSFDARSGAAGSVMFSYTHRFGVIGDEQPPFEIYAEGEVLGRVFVDSNENGQFDEGEKALGNVLVTLDGQRKQRTDAQGRYRFTNVKAGSHGLEIDGQTVPARTRFTTPSPAQVMVQEARTLPTDFGITSGAELVGRLYDDLDGDGQPGLSEPGVGRVRVVIEGPAGQQEAETTSYGHFRFTALEPGDYRVEVDESTLPVGYLPLVESEQTVTLAPLAQVRADFISHADRAAAGIVFRDDNWNGRRDGDEPPIAGATISCGPLVVKSNDKGRYICRDLAPGELTVAVAPLPDTTAVHPEGLPVSFDVEPRFADKLDLGLRPSHAWVENTTVSFSARDGRLDRRAERLLAGFAKKLATLPNAFKIAVEGDREQGAAWTQRQAALQRVLYQLEAAGLPRDRVVLEDPTALEDTGLRRRRGQGRIKFRLLAPKEGES